MTGIKLSQLTKQDTITDTALIPFTNLDGVSRNISYQNFKANLEKGGVSAKVNSDPLSEVAVVSVQNDNIGLATNSGGVLTLDVSKLPTNVPVNSIKYVRTADDLAGALDSSVAYVLDGVINMGTQTVLVPATGLTIIGFSFDVSGLFSDQPNHTVFSSPVGGSGNLYMRDFKITTNGTGSKVYNLTDSDGLHAVEVLSVNFDNCKSLGEINGYRQGFESGTGRIFGSPELTLSGTWVGGYRATSSIAVVLDAGFTGTLFKAGAGFVMNNRFLTDMNVDLPAGASFSDFTTANFPNPSTIQVKGGTFTRNGVSNPNDTNILPNLSPSNLECDWDNNRGIGNTYVGGTTTLSGESVTNIVAASTFYNLAGTYSTADLQHFDSPSQGSLRHIGTNPRDYKINLFYVVTGNSGDSLSLKIQKWDDSSAGFVDVITQTKAVNNLVGGDDLAFFNIVKSVTLDQNDYIKLQISNNSNTNNVTARLESFYEIAER